MNTRKFKNKIKPITVALLVISSMFTVMLLMLPLEQTIVKAGIVKSEDCEDISEWWHMDDDPGDFKPGTNTYVAHGGTYSCNISSDGSGSCQIVLGGQSISDTACTMVCWVYTNDTTDDLSQVIGVNNNVNSTADKVQLIMNEAGSVPSFWIQIGDEGGAAQNYNTTTAVPVKCWFQIRVVCTSGRVAVFLNESVIFNQSGLYTTGDTFTDIQVGNSKDTNSDDYYIDDVIVYDSVEWPSVGGGVETCYYNISGLDGSDRVTFGSGTAGTVLWSNASSNWDAGAMLNIQVSTNATVSIDDICINLKDSDLHTSVHWENISIDVAYHTTSFASANATFPNDWYSFGDEEGDYNISLNASWDTDWGGANPFPLTNDTVGADHFFCVRFRLAVPSDATAGGPYTTDQWEVIWKTIGE